MWDKNDRQVTFFIFLERFVSDLDFETARECLFKADQEEWDLVVDTNPSQEETKSEKLTAFSFFFFCEVIQLAKFFGCYVATTCSTENLKYCTDLGADLVLDYSKQRVEELISNFDVVQRRSKNEKKNKKNSKEGMKKQDGEDDANGAKRKRRSKK